ncbi:protein AATF-like [Argonauta hians]
MALSELLQSLSKPTPTFQDIEDDFGDSTTAQLSVPGSTPGDVSEASTALRRRAAALLSDTDNRYSGQKATRRAAMAQFEGGTDDDDDDDDIKGFHQLVQKKTQGSDTVADDDDDEEGEDDDDDEEEEGEDDSDDDDDGSGGSDDDEAAPSDDDDDDDSNNDDNDDDDDDESKTITTVATTIRAAKPKKEEEEGEKGGFPGVDFLRKAAAAGDALSDRKKGEAVKTQLGFLDNLLEGRIKLQRAASLVNQLPPPAAWHSFLEDSRYSMAAHTVQSQLCQLLNTLIQLQTCLLMKDTQTQHVVTGEDRPGDQHIQNDNDDDDDDEEIPSDDEVINGVDDSNNNNNKDDGSGSGGGGSDGGGKASHSSAAAAAGGGGGGHKRKAQKTLTAVQIPGFLAKRARLFEPCRNAIIHKWDTKARLVSGKINKKSFDSLEQSTLKQVEQVLYDRERLVRRTQIQRSSYKIFGKPDRKEAESDEQVPPGGGGVRREAEIFDDSDFYHLLLQEFIKRKSGGVGGGDNRPFLELQQLKKKKRDVDPRASKGRKLRYDVHKKLVNFMGPIDQSSWPDEARDELYRSLFGQYNQIGQ